MKKKKYLVGMMVMMLLLLAASTNVWAASKKAKALKAYRKMLEASTVQWDDNGKTVRADTCSFALAYVNKDAVPELIVKSYFAGTLNGYYSVYTYKGGKVKFLVNTGLEVGYVKKKGVLYGKRLFTVPQGGPGDAERYYKINNKGGIDYGLVYDSRVRVSYNYYKESYGANYKSNALEKDSYSKAVNKLIGNRKLVNTEKIKFYGSITFFVGLTLPRFRLQCRTPALT